MPRARADRTAAVAFDALTVEGALIAPAILARIAHHQAEGQSEPDYGVPKGLTLRDEIARYFRMGQALFKELTASETPSLAAATNVVENLLREVLGFADLCRAGTKTIGDRQFTLTLEALGGRVPIVVVPSAEDLDRPSTHLTTDGRKRSAASALQDWLNAEAGALWGLASNGTRLRLTRDNASLTRPAYIEADLRRMFEADLFADFAALWLIVHASRFGVAGAPPSDCALERWREAGLKEGVAAREKLRDGVETALVSLGNGLLSHPENKELRDKLRKGALPLPDFFGQLLRLVYRLIFLFAAETATCCTRRMLRRRRARSTPTATRSPLCASARCGAPPGTAITTAGRGCSSCSPHSRAVRRCWGSLHLAACSRRTYFPISRRRGSPGKVS